MQELAAHATAPTQMQSRWVSLMRLATRWGDLF